MSGVHSTAGIHKKRLLAVFIITTGVLVVEVVAGVVSGSLALLADAGHMLTDVAGVGMALLAIQLGARPATDARTFGLYRVEILAAVVNALLLFGAAGWVLFAAWRRFSHPPEVGSGVMLGAALVGLAANGMSMWLLRHAQRQSINMRGAYLEVMGDLLGSVAVVGAAAFIAVTGYQRADVIASAAIGILIIPRTWRLLRDAIDVLLEASPKNVNLTEVRSHILGAGGVADVHDLHAWTITSGLPVVSAHVVLTEGADPAAVLDSLSACLATDFDIEHSTFQLETFDRRRVEQAGHP